MKIKLITLLIILTIMASCNSQNRIDLAEIKIPLDKAIIINDDYIVTNNKFKMMGLDIYSSFDNNLLFFNNVDINGRLTDSKDDLLNANMVELYVDETEDKIKGFKITAYTKTKKILNLLKKKLGDPVFNLEKSFAIFTVWEEKESNKIYLLEYNLSASINNIKTTTIRLTVLNTNDIELIDYFGTGGFGYYTEYIEERDKNNISNYSYKDFANDKAEYGRKSYLRGIPK